MPSLKMKTKLNADCLRQKNGLHVCQKSSTISKHSCSRIRISQQTAEFESCIQSCQDVSSSNEVSTQDTGSNEAAIDQQELLDAENLQFQMELSSLVDPITMENTEYATVPWPSNLETIFSPVLESVDVHSELNILNSAGSYNEPYLAQLIDLPIDGNSMYDDIIGINPFPDYKCGEPSMLFDVAEQCMILPFLEDTREARNIHSPTSCEEAMVGSDNSSLYLAIHQMRSCNQESDINPCSDQDQAECFDPHLFIRNLPDLSDVVANSRPTILPKETRKKKSITLVLDLDETLVHSTLEHCDDADFTFPVFFNMKDHTVYVKQRPYLHTFLERVAEMFEIVVFTASQSIYAEQLLDILDPDGKFFSHRAYRESCIFSDGSYTKDLTVLGIDLAKVAIIDNSPQVFQLQVNNGIPIKSWFDDPSDHALISLLPFLETLVDADDVRPIIAKRFGNKE
ncbi:uncharacterized protein LOC100258847 isoform X3 [Vitis vinifera]|uniref:uncharacterized protein LOC100258847 isoform X3 n=1 Tax=Vitis vinifera TaxID=29760 RepID=UPI00053FDF4B|nr:uncharacterized protein LOC100258847 isoform X3 [Vitis vinifera]|eukprot:XP_010655625.1 PREDICTED: uncharacterized protein LOC100258847 isoform X3 [Vitis vinifera]